MIIKIPARTYYRQLDTSRRWMTTLTAQERPMTVDKIIKNRIYGYVKIQNRTIYCSVARKDLPMNINHPFFPTGNTSPPTLPHI